MLKRLKKRLEAKEAEKRSLVEKSKTSGDIDELRNINSKVDDLNDEILELREMVEEAQEKDSGESGQEERTKAVNNEDEEIEQRSFTPGQGFNPVAKANLDTRAVDDDEAEYEKRGIDLKEKRTVTVSASNIVLPQHTSKNINGTFNEVSSLIDRVTIKPLKGGESYTRSYVKGYGEGDGTGEGEAAADAEPTFGYAAMNKVKVTAYAEETEEVEKLPAASYAKEVEKGVRIAMRKKVNREILTGDGTAKHLMGIYNSTTIELSTDLEVVAIDESTLDDIVFSYGGDEEVEDAAVLLLNKLDLKEFVKLRNTDGKRVHKVIPNGNTGTIDGIPYLINSKANALSDAGTIVGSYTMAYGTLSSYELAIFSDAELSKSTEYKFKEGNIAHKGAQYVGGNVTKHNGFIRVKKKSGV